MPPGTVRVPTGHAMRKLFVNLLVASSATLLALFLLEAGVRIYIRHFAGEEEFLKYASLRQLQERDSEVPVYSLHRYLGYYPTPGYARGGNRHNALGYRGDEIELPKPEGELRIVCLGGSTTYTGHVGDYRKSYPYLLGTLLQDAGHRVTVVNAGAAGWSSWESLINFELRVLDLDPDLVIVYHGINDVHPRLVWPPSAYRGDNSGRRAPVTTGLFMPGVLEYSALYRLVTVRAGLREPHASFERTIDEVPPTYFGNRFIMQQRQGSYPRGFFEQVSAARMLEANPPRYFERNLRNLVALARANGVEVVLSTFAYSPDFPKEPQVASREYRAALDEGNQVVRRVSAETGAHFFDFAARFPPDQGLYTDGRHVNEAGAARKAELFAEYLVAEQLVSSPTRAD